MFTGSGGGKDSEDDELGREENSPINLKELQGLGRPSSSVGLKDKILEVEGVHGVNEAELGEYFNNLFGNVFHVVLPRFKSGLTKGRGYIMFFSREVRDHVVEFGNFLVKGVYVRVKAFDGDLSDLEDDKVDDGNERPENLSPRPPHQTQQPQPPPLVRKTNPHSNQPTSNRHPPPPNGYIISHEHQMISTKTHPSTHGSVARPTDYSNRNRMTDQRTIQNIPPSQHYLHRQVPQTNDLRSVHNDDQTGSLHHHAHPVHGSVNDQRSTHFQRRVLPPRPTLSSGLPMDRRMGQDRNSGVLQPAPGYNGRGTSDLDLSGDRHDMNRGDERKMTSLLGDQPHRSRPNRGSGLPTSRNNQNQHHRPIHTDQPNNVPRNQHRMITPSRRFTRPSHDPPHSNRDRGLPRPFLPQMPGLGQGNSVVGGQSSETPRFARSRSLSTNDLDGMRERAQHNRSRWRKWKDPSTDHKKWDRFIEDLRKKDDYDKDKKGNL